MDCLACLRNILYIDVGKYENINYIYDSDLLGHGQKLHSLSSPRKRNGKLSSVRMVKFIVRMVGSWHS